MPFWISIVEWSARIILVGMIGLSIWSIAIIFDRYSFFKKLSKEEFINGLLSMVTDVPLERAEKLVAANVFLKKQELEKGLGVLGTLGAITPFIGLLGTILGIIVAFGELSLGNTGTNTIMFALAEALILTAVGLFVAIPAVIAFNFFKQKTKLFFDASHSEFQSQLYKEESQRG